MKFTTILACAACLSSMILSSCGGSSSASYDNVDLIPVTTSKTGKWSMVNPKGEIVYDSEFKNQPTAAYNGLFSVEESNGYSVYKVDGKSPEAVNGLENLKSVGYLEDGLIPVTFPSKRIALADANGEIQFELNPTKGVEITCCAPGFSDGMLWFGTEDEKYGYIDGTGKIVIPPTYKDVSSYSEGLAVVTKIKDDNSSDKTILIIDKKGKEVFKLKEGYELVNRTFKHGYILAQNDGRFYLFNKKGEEKKLSAKIASVYDYNTKYLIYRNEEGEVGVMDFDDNIIIRPKYNFITFGLGNFFIAKKDSDSKEFVKIDTNGEESSEKIDYSGIAALGKFGYIAQEGKTMVLLNDKFTKKGKEDFFDINMSWYRGTVYSNYFDIVGVAETMVKMIDGNKVGDLALGSSASEIFIGKSPSDYAWKKEVSFDNMTKKGLNYEINVMGSFTANIAELDGYYYNTKYVWNPSAKLFDLTLKLQAPTAWGTKGHEALKKAIAADGYKLIQEGSKNNITMTLFKKDTLLIGIISGENSAQINLIDDISGHITSGLISIIEEANNSNTPAVANGNSVNINGVGNVTVGVPPAEAEDEYEAAEAVVVVD